MDISYEWKIDLIEYIPTAGEYQDFIVSVHATYVGSVGETKAYRAISNMFNSSAQGGSYIPLETILEDKSIVVGWLESLNDLSLYQSDMEKELDNYLNPPTTKIGNPYNE